jgi:hypothetical protein
MRDELKKLGYVDEQIPAWVAEAAAEAAQAEAAKAEAAKAAIAAQAELPTLPEAVEPLNPPVRTGRAKKIEAAQLSSGQLSSGQGMQLSQTATEAALEAANKMLGPGGQRIEALGSDALQRWMQENGVEERNGEYWQRQKLPTGQNAFVQVTPPKEVVDAENLGNAQVSSMIFRYTRYQTV